VSEYTNRRRGSSQEFFDYKAYTPGDDLRNINWKSYIRHRKLFTRTFHEEAYFYVHILIDNSRSISGFDDKRYTAVRFACALAYIALSLRLPVHFELLCKRTGQPAHFSSNNLNDIENFLLSAMAGYSPLNQFENFKNDSDTLVNSVTEYCRTNFRKSGVVFYISDLLYDCRKLNEMLKKLIAANFETRTVHIVSQFELPAQFVSGYKTVRLIDSETGEFITTRINAEEYSISFMTHLTKIDETLKLNGLPVLRFISSEPVTIFIRNNLQQLGLVR
jgi:hypothetical protein